jgi:hypothetical protein
MLEFIFGHVGEPWHLRTTDALTVQDAQLDVIQIAQVHVTDHSGAVTALASVVATDAVVALEDLAAFGVQGGGVNQVIVRGFARDQPNPNKEKDNE